MDEMNRILEICFEGKQRVDPAQFKKINEENFEGRLLRGIQSTTVRYLAETLEGQFMPFDLIDMLEEAAQINPAFR